MTQNILAAVLIILLSACSAGPKSPPVAMTFAAYGDMPYMVTMADGRTDEQVLIQDVAPKIRQRAGIPFVIHLGDIGRSDVACTDSWLEKTRLFWEKDLVKPVFYTPGDNEWTDCDREKLVVRSSELDRLAAIRRILFGRPKFLAPQWRYEEQVSLPENQTWWYGGVRFVTQHIVNSNNGRTDILLDDLAQAVRFVDERDMQNKIWLDHAFEMSHQGDTSAVVVAMQADLFGPPDGKNDALSRCMNKPAYRDFCSHLQSLALKLDKPVLLIHGDTNAYCLDQPMPAAPNLWRLNAPGDFKVTDAALISFDFLSPDKPFSVHGLLSGKPAPQVCDYAR